MKNALKSIPVVLSFLLLAAHFLRAGWTVLVLVCLVFPAVLFIRRRWALRTVQVVLILGGIEWLRTAWILVQGRLAAGEPWLRMVIILGTVAAVAIGSAWLLQQRSFLDRCPATPPDRPASA